MQAHSAFHRHTFSIPNPSRRFTTSSPRLPVRPAPLSKLLCSAVAVTACKSLTLGTETSFGGGGGAGWLVLCFWAGRLSSEGRHEWRRRTKGKGKEKGKEQTITFGAREMFTAILLAAQSLLFALSLNAIGPLRSTLLVVTSTLVVAGPYSTWRSVAIMVPVMVSCLIILMKIAQDNGSILAALPLILLCAATMALQRSSPQTSGQSKDPRPPSAFVTLFASGVIAASAVISAWTMDLIPAPWPVFTSETPLLSFLTPVLAYWLPLNFPSTLTSKSSLRFRTTRDYVALLGSIFALQAFAFHPQPSQLDSLIIGPLALISMALYEPPLPPLKEDAHGWRYPAPAATSQSWSIVQLLPAAWRPHVQTILNTPSSSKIFYFLLLNLGYMGVQMVYGVLTNSLGLISDAIHMAFDCLGLAVGLWASVASTWKPDQQYTFGYGRVETLSGFANGCFLILISVFIIFEAIQRVMNPPQLMAIDRLLWVSSVGLAINLFGMWATGGHHHHGHGHHHDHGHDHSHSHGHDHGHGHHHVAVNEKKVDHRHDHGEKPALHRKASQGFSHSVNASPPRQARKRSSQLNLKSHPTESTKIHPDASYPDDHHKEHDHHKEDDHHKEHEHHHDHTHASTETCHEHHGHSHDHAHVHKGDHDHSHDHSHDRAHSHNMRGVFLHVMADTLGSVGVIISTILIKYTGWSGFDPLASIFIAVLIMASVIPLVIDSGRILCLDVGEGKEKEIRTALAELASVEGLSNYASPRFWPRCEGELVGSIHIHLAPSPSAVDPSKPSSDPGKDSKGQTIYSNSAKVISRVEKVLKGKIMGLSELIIQVEGSEDRPFCTCTTGR